METNLLMKLEREITFDKDSHGKSKKAQEPAYLKKAQEPGKSKKAQEPGKSKKAQEPGKPNKAQEPMECDGSSTAENNKNIEDNLKRFQEANEILRTLHKDEFRRKFDNPDMATCWLNSCLQLVLAAMDHNADQVIFNSELGEELLRLQSSESFESLDPTTVKIILVTSEDTRISIRLSELVQEITDQEELEHQTQTVEGMRLDLLRGQQCVRDFFVCLNENLLSWPDVFSFLSFEMTNSTTCSLCHHRNESNVTQLYVELQVPPTNSNLKDFVEDSFNEGTEVGRNCQDGCKQFSVGSHRSTLADIDKTQFIIIILTRGVQTLDGYHLVRNEVHSTDDIFIR